MLTTHTWLIYDYKVLFEDNIADAEGFLGFSMVCVCVCVAGARYCNAFYKIGIFF